MRGRTITVRVSCIVMLVYGLASLVLAEVPWRAQVDEWSEKHDKPALLYFTASWCGPCRLMKSTTFKDKSLKKIWEGVRPYLVDYDAHVELATRNRVKGIPCIVLFNLHGEEVARVSGYVKAKDLLEWWEKNKGAAMSNESIRARETKKRESRLATLSKGYAASGNVRTTLFDDIKRGKHVKSHEMLLNEHWKLDRDSLFKSLSSAHLFERVLAGRYLARRGMKFDPWADAKVRESRLENLKKTWPKK